MNPRRLTRCLSGVMLAAMLATGTVQPAAAAPENTVQLSASALAAMQTAPAEYAPLVETCASTNYWSLSSQGYEWWFIRQEGHKKSVSGAAAGVDFKSLDAWYINPATNEKVIYLTFDCGYENGFTSKILKTLKKHGAKALFFVTGAYVKSQPSLVKQMKREGHLVGNHTVTHPNLAGMSPEGIRAEISGCASIMKKMTGYEMDPYLRPPAGAYSQRSLAVTRDLGYHTVFWSMAYQDWNVNQQPGKAYVVDHFRKYVHPGAIPLIHTVSSSNAEALDTVLTNLEKAGYRFGTVDEFILKKGKLKISAHSKVYDGKPVEIRILRNTNAGAKVTVEIFNEEGRKVKKAVKPGRYTAIAHVEATSQYRAADSNVIKFRIRKK